MIPKYQIFCNYSRIMTNGIFNQTEHSSTL